MSNYYFPNQYSNQYPNQCSSQYHPNQQYNMCPNPCYAPNCLANTCDIIEGNSVDVQLNDADCEIRADLALGRKECIRLWGQVLDCNGQPIANAQVKLLQCGNRCHGMQFEGVAHTITDCLGYYQFDLCPEDRGKCFRIVAGKSVKSFDRVIQGQENCNPCNGDCTL